MQIKHLQQLVSNSGARHHFVQRAWFTPLPVANWARAEAWVAETAGLDFLLLPMEDAALTTLADWLGSGRARLVQHPQAPFRFPPLIKGQELDWAVRRVAPPEDVLAQLLHELRGYLGPKRMQWLAACAVFPALAWPLTLALGRKLIEDDGERAVGLAALAALPWFRQGRMPGWLREVLLNELTDEVAVMLRAELTRRLRKALEPEGEVIARVSRLSMLSWIRLRRGIARDVLLVRFLEPSRALPLMQQLPDLIGKYFSIERLRDFIRSMDSFFDKIVESAPSYFEGELRNIDVALDWLKRRPNKIYICYRRSSGLVSAHLVFLHLRKFFRDRLILDVDEHRLRTNEEFQLHLNRRLDDCAAILVLMDSEWAYARYNTTGARRLLDAQDSVRLEIMLALQRDIAVIPVLLNSARMPYDSELPPELRPLLLRQAYRLDLDHDFDSGMKALATKL